MNTLKTYVIMRDSELYQQSITNFLLSEKRIEESLNRGEVTAQLREQIRKINCDNEDNAIIKVWNDIKCDFSTDPLDEILATTDCLNYDICSSDSYTVVAVERNNVILGYISVLIDKRIKINGNKAAFFIGIRKSVAFLIAKELMNDDLKVSKLLIPAVEEIARKYDCSYVFTSPLNFMYHYLINNYGFMPLNPGCLTVTYQSPNLTLLDIEDEGDAVYKKL